MSAIGRVATPDSAAALATAGAIRIIRRGSNGLGIRYSGPKLQRRAGIGRGHDLALLGLRQLGDRVHARRSSSPR